MDRHIVPGVEARHAAEAHREDLKIQDEFGCRCMTYWVDEDRESAFCLIDAPNIEAVTKMHNKAHGLIVHEIVQVNSNVVEAFLGRIQDPEGYYPEDDPDLKIFNDPAFRIILVTQVSNLQLLQHNFGKEKALKLFNLYNEIMHDQIKKHEGREVENKGEDFIASFVSVTQAISCAKSIQKRLHIAAEILNLRISINAGMPVTKSKTLFGDTVKMANYLCDISEEGQIIVASIIREIYKSHRNSDDNFKWIKPSDENFLQLLMNILEENANNSQFGVNDFCEKMSMSRSKMYRKCTAITGKSLNALLKDYRLLKSLDLLKTGLNISQTTFDIGFTSPSYFTKCFQNKFGIQPLTYLKSLS